MAREGFVRLRAYRTWYRIVGDPEAAVPLLALHGGPGSTHHYFAPLEQLADERAVVVYDQLGCGHSDRPSDLEWTVDMFKEELAALREQLGLNDIHLLGTSWGGMLALEHVLSGAPGIVSLVLSSTLASIDEWTQEVARLRSELPPETVATLDRLEAAHAYDNPEYAAAEQLLFDRHFYRGAKPRPELERMREERGSEVYRAMIGPNEWTITGALRGWDVRDRLPEIHMPTLVIRGRHDMSTDPINATLLAGIPHARDAVLEESSHTPILEETDRYLAIVRAFLRDAEALREPTAERTNGGRLSAL